MTASTETPTLPAARGGFSLLPAGADGRANAAIGALVFFFTLAIYTYCLYPTTPYWDSGEYIATSYILGIPHPPGTPLYVLIGRLFSMLPFASPAVLVNFLSGFSAAVAVLFTYLITVRIVRRNWADSGWLAFGGGVVAALFMAFGPTFWDNAVEAEVYASASAITCFCVWLALVWWDHQGEARNDRILWLILYVLFLAIGVHMGAFLVFPCIYLLVTMVHWKRVNKSAFWGSIGIFVVAALIRTGIILNANRLYGVTELSIAPESMRTGASIVSLIMLAAVAWNVVSVLGRRFALGIGVLAALGVSVHFYLLIRAGLDPAINEADPYTWEALKLVLTRDQYKPPEPIFPKADRWYQFSHMYWRYFEWQFVLAKLGSLPTHVVPILVGLVGGWANWNRERKSFWLMATLLLITGPFLVYYLNFREGEVRERDYFFVANYHFFAIWIGLGVASLARMLAGAWEKVVEPRDLFRPAVVGVTALGIVMSVLPLVAGENNNNFHRHNRRGNWVAHGYAHNMLVGLEPNAIIFTNGDNDTFPLWYIQEVENFRKDVRVVNLSLLQTHWYIKQLRDYEPKVPVQLDDGQINALQPYRERDGRIMYVNDFMVQHIIEKNAWKQPVYFAVTVPDQRGMDRQMRMEGLVFRIYPEPQESAIDVAKLRENLDTKYHYRGFLTPTGEYDLSVYKDEQATRLLQNYAAARVRLALGLHAEGRTDEARRELQKVQKYAIHFPGVDAALGASYAQIGLAGEAESYYRDILAGNPDNAGALSVLGHLRIESGDTTEAIRLLLRAIELNPAGDFNPYADLANIYQARGEIPAVVQLLEQWLTYHPDDERIRGYLAQFTGRPPAGVP